MRRITIWFSTVILAFAAGLLITFGFGQFNFSVPATQSFSSHPAPANLNGKMELKFIRFISNFEHTYAQYQVINGSPETVQYPGYASNSNSLIFIKQGGLITPGEISGSVHYFGIQSLLPGDTFISDVPLPEGKGSVKIGFAYEVEGDHNWEIAWSEEFELPGK